VDTLVYATNISDQITLDPAQMYAWTWIMTVNNLYQGLVKFEVSDYSAVRPALEEKREVAETANGNDLTFTLKDGNPVTAEDVVYSYQRVVTLKKGPSFLFTDIAGLNNAMIAIAAVTWPHLCQAGAGAGSLAVAQGFC
jgi:peptide/nickel transport system substrate-binding protein